MSKVVSFRIDDVLSEEVENAKAKSGLSYSDLIRLGSGIADSHIKSKMDEVTGLQDRIVELNYKIQEKEEELEKLKQPIEEQLEQERADKELKLERDLARRQRDFEDRMDVAYRQLAEVNRKTKQLEEEKDRLEAEIKAKKEQLSQVTNDLCEYKQKYSDAKMANVMMSSMMGLSMLGAVGNITQSLSQGKPPSQTDTTKPNLQQDQYLPPQPNITDATALLTQCLPVLMMGMMASVLGSAARKKPAPPEAEPTSRPLLDFAQRLNQVRTQKTEPELETTQVEGLPEEEEAEDKDETVAEELDED